MSYARRGLRALGVSILAALGLMAVTAGGAQGDFLVENGTAPIAGALENPLESNFRILGLNIEFFCHGGTASGSVELIGHGHATLELTECLVQGVNSAGELVGEPCALENNIVAKTLVSLILHNEKPYLLFSPLEGEVFAMVSGEPCPIPDSTVKGSVVASISNPDGDDVTKLISTKGNLSLFTSGKLFYGKNEAHMSADATVELTGAFKGVKWGAA